ncbi:MAG: rhombosortase [Gammaproteobacteria bacterium]
MLLQAGGRTVIMPLRYQRDAILQGEIWRLWTGNLVHLGWEHLALNMAGLTLVWVICGAFLTRLEWLAVWCLSFTAVGIGLLLGSPGVAWYVGLSGSLHGLLVAGIAVMWSAGERRLWPLAVFLVAKLVWEQWRGAIPLSAAVAGGPVVVDAHLYGALGGVLAGALLVAARHLRAASR